MTGSADCRDIRHALGVYVLGAIDPAERSKVDAHLSTCPDCREELAGLAGLPALLRRIPVGEAQQLADGEPDGLSGDGLAGPEVPSVEMLDSLLGRTTQARQARRWRGLAAAAALVLVAGVGGGAAWGLAHHAADNDHDSVASASFSSVSATDPVTHVAATVKYAGMSWGTVLDTQVKDVPAGDRCELLVTDSSGHTTVVGSWTTTYDEKGIWYPGSSGVTLDSVRSFEVTADGKVLVKVPAR